jgi:hypothetical protein
MKEEGRGGRTGAGEPVAICGKFYAGDGLFVALQRVLEDVVGLLAHLSLKRGVRLVEADRAASPRRRLE